MNLPLPKTTQGVYRLSVSTFYFLQGLVFASWACRIPDIKNALGLNDADLGSVLFAVPVGQMSAMALSGYLVGRCGSRRILIAASIFYPAVLVYLGMASSFWELAAGLFFFGVAANLTISPSTRRAWEWSGCTSAASWPGSMACGAWRDSSAPCWGR